MKFLTKFGSKRFSPIIAIGAHGAVAGSCVAGIATAPSFNWMTMLQGVMLGWCIGAILVTIIIERAMKHNDLTRQILNDYGNALDMVMKLAVENFAMRQYFLANNIEFTITRDGDHVSATTEYKDPTPDDANAVDPHAGEDRTLH